jgi:hypothetical protein
MMRSAFEGVRKRGMAESVESALEHGQSGHGRLGALMKTRQQMNELGYTPEVAPAVLHFLTERLGDKDISDLRRAIPRKDLVEAWKDLDANAHSLAKR